ncbi:MAG: DUF2336 domain-containing protein [Rhodospirillales bacterium]|nr:DUF2336 domain-containing protein [Rhodospirillales bacterium]MDH3910170.1 DUF2336 domain-containing protein [Rhodospirillales bacterium]MDH3966374.1 DUF2336 domain-containing protein [Rhodospirillales bacterium]
MQVPRDSAPKSSDGRPGRTRPAPNGDGAAACGPEPLPEDVGRQVREALAEHLRRCPYLPPTLSQTLSADALSLRLPAGSGVAPLAGPSEGTGAVNGTGPQQARQPLNVLQRAIYGLCGDLCQHLAERHDLPPELAGDMALHGRERALTRAMGPDDPKAEIDRLVAGLAAEAMLTPTLLLRGLCLGRLDFFRAAMARLAALPLDQAGHRILDDGPDGFIALYEKSGLPPVLFRAFRAALDVVRRLPPEEAREWQRASTDAIISRLVNEYEEVCPEDLEHVLSQLSRRLAEPPHNGIPLGEDIT